MDTKKGLTMVFGLSFTILGLVALAWAGNVQLNLMADKSHSGAGGTATLSENSFSAEAKGLRPNAVYTVWFVNMKPKKQEVGVGQPPYMFKTNAEGSGSYSASLSTSPFGKWEAVMIVLHPKGDPMNMKDMVPALSTMIPKSSG
jgi:hypothetical protein